MLENVRELLESSVNVGTLEYAHLKIQFKNIFMFRAEVSRGLWIDPFLHTLQNSALIYENESEISLVWFNKVNLPTKRITIHLM